MSDNVAQRSNGISTENIQRDTVAGTIRVEVVSLQSGNIDVLPANHPFAEVVVPRQAPVITDVTFENETTNGFDIVISGYSSPRDMSTIVLTFTARAGTTIEGSAQVTVNVGDLFTRFYGSAASLAGGSTFTGLRLPVSINGDKSVIASVGVVLTNSAGSSNQVTRAR